MKQFSRLRIGDIKQYMTLPEVLEIEGSNETQLVYKTFMLSDKGSKTQVGTRKIRFSLDHPTAPMSEHDKLKYSYQLLAELGTNSKDSLVSVHPQLFRELNYMAIVTPDTITPMSEEVARAFDIEQYNLMMQNPAFDPEQTARLLLSAYDRTKKDPDKYLAKQAPGQQPGIQPPQPPPGMGQPPQNQQPQPIQPPAPTPMASRMTKPTPRGARPLIPR